MLLYNSLLAGTDEMPSYFEGIAVDQLSNQLFLTSKNSRAIFKMPAEMGGKPTKFLSTLNKKPTGISIDSCSREAISLHISNSFLINT